MNEFYWIIFCSEEKTSLEDVEKILENEIAFHPGPHELVWINGNIDNGQVEVHSSLLQSKSDLIFSPLVGDLVDVMNGSSLENVSFNSKVHLHSI